MSPQPHAFVIFSVNNCSNVINVHDRHPYWRVGLTIFNDPCLFSDKWTGIITTSRITHATPGGAYATTPERKWESDAKAPAGCKDIAAQLVEDHNYIRVERP